MALPADGYISSSSRTTGEFKTGMDDIVTDIARGNPEYISTRTFEKGAKCKASNDVVYTSLKDGNLNNTPQADDGTNWYASTFDNVLGLWEDLTGSVSVGHGIYYSDLLWRVSSDISDVALSVPSNSNSSYTLALGSTELINSIDKEDGTKSSFYLDGSTVKTSQKIKVTSDSGIFVLDQESEITLPFLVDGTDYRILCLSDGSLSVLDWDATDPSGSIVIGGFHVYHTTGGVNENSFWDLNWRPSGHTPRGMTLSPDGNTWVDIYFMDEDYALFGYSRPAVNIADDGLPPIIPTIYGGNGTTTYGSLTWFEAWDLAISAGKRLPTWGEFTGFSYGVVEEQSFGSDPITTGYRVGHRSSCGVEQATGGIWQWGADCQASGTGWLASTDGRGSLYASSLSCVRMGGSWDDGVYSGSRSANWNGPPSLSAANIGARAVCNHVIL